MVNKIIALDKEIEITGQVILPNNTTEALALVNEYDADLAKELSNVTFKMEIKESTLYLYRDDAHFG